MASTKPGTLCPMTLIGNWQGYSISESDAGGVGMALLSRGQTEGVLHVGRDSNMTLA